MATKSSARRQTRAWLRAARRKPGRRFGSSEPGVSAPRQGRPGEGAEQGADREADPPVGADVDEHAADEGAPAMPSWIAAPKTPISHTPPAWRA